MPSSPALRVVCIRQSGSPWPDYLFLVGCLFFGAKSQPGGYLGGTFFLKRESPLCILYTFFIYYYMHIMHKSKTVPNSRVGVCAYYGYKNTIYCIILYSKHTGWVWIVSTHKSCMSIYKYILTDYDRYCTSSMDKRNARAPSGRRQAKNARPAGKNRI